MRLRVMRVLIDHGREPGIYCDEGLSPDPVHA
jgi:hypothetical protein